MQEIETSRPWTTHLPGGAAQAFQSFGIRIMDFEFRASLLPLALLAAALAVLMGGCAAGPQRLPVCPGKATTEEALQALATRAEAAVPLRANGRAMLTYHVPDKKKPERHNLPMQMRFNPPAEIYIQGSIGVDPQAVVIGANEEEFWLALRPKEMSSYYSGRWEDVGEFEGLMMSPRVVLEAFGIVAEPGGAPSAALWTLENEGPYDVLTRRDESGRMVKRVYVYACDYVVYKVEYFDRRGKLAAVAQLRDYKPVADGFRVPTRIYVVSIAPDGRKDTIDIDINSTKPMKFTEQLRERIFVPPDANKFENIYRYDEGRWVPE